MICCVGYMDTDEGKFTYIKNDSYFIPMWISVYLQTIILHEIHDFFVLDKSMKKRLETTCSKNITELLKVFRYFIEQSEDNRYKFKFLIDRLELIKH